MHVLVALVFLASGQVLAGQFPMPSTDACVATGRALERAAESDPAVRLVEWECRGPAFRAPARDRGVPA